MPEPQEDPKPGAPPSPSGDPSPGAADPARVEREARLESDAQSWRSFHGRLKAAGVAKLNAEELSELIAAGKAAKEAAEAGAGEPGNEDDPEKAKGKAIAIAEHKEAIRRVREEAKEREAQAIQVIKAERDEFKRLWMEGLVKTELTTMLGDSAFADFDVPNVFDALLSPRVPFSIAVDEESKSLIVLDKKTGQEYRDPESRSFLVPREALAALPRFASYVRKGTLPGGSGAGSGSNNGASRGRKPDPSQMTSREKIATQFVPAQGR